MKFQSILMDHLKGRNRCTKIDLLIYLFDEICVKNAKIVTALISWWCRRRRSRPRRQR